MLERLLLSLLFVLPSSHFNTVQSVDVIKEMKNTVTINQVAQAVKDDEREEKQIHIKQVGMVNKLKTESETKKTAEKIINKKKNNDNWTTYRITAYDSGVQSTGKSPGDKGYRITKSGEKVKEGRTVSADLNILPIGTVIEIESVGIRTITDSGSAIRGRRLDLYIESHKEALNFGVRNLKVRIIKMGKGKI
ncbi:3D (Asp-Asp-Asp) domain-containing protein [Paenibacillus sophorae]|nr:3D (Asp-Asp-Asp) domain-containing protein [Paenibacillus sophorae]